MDIQTIFDDNNLKNAVLLDEKHARYDSLPNVWKELATESETERKKAILLRYWNPFKEKLPKIYRILSDDLLDAYVVEHNGTITMVYVFDSNGDIITYQGGLPAQGNPFLANMPQGIAEFYERIHDGWSDTVNGGLGFVSLEDVRYLDEFEWGFLEKEPVAKVDLAKTYYVFHNGAGGYICISDTNDGFRYLLWFDDEKPTLNIDFWSYFNAWVQMNFGYEEL